MTGPWYLLWLLIVVPVSCALAPLALVRIPEPSQPELPPEGAVEETELDRILRAEGPKELYADLARHPRLVPWTASIAGLLFLLAEGGFPAVPFVVAAALVPVLTLLWVIDWRTRLLPRIVVRPLTVVVVMVALLDWLVRRDTDALLRECCGGLLAWLIFGLLWFVRRAGMGLGDVRLALPLGMLTSAVSWNAWMISLYAGFVGFAVFGICLMLIKRDRGVLGRAYPFGPFMIAGAYAGMALSPHLRILG